MPAAVSFYSMRYIDNNPFNYCSTAAVFLYVSVWYCCCLFPTSRMPKAQKSSRPKRKRQVPARLHADNPPTAPTKEKRSKRPQKNQDAEKEQEMVDKITAGVLAKLNGVLLGAGNSAGQVTSSLVDTAPSTSGPEKNPAATAPAATAPAALPKTVHHPSDVDLDSDQGGASEDSGEEEGSLARAVSGTLNELMNGESVRELNTINQAQGPQFESAATPLGFSLSPKLKAAIWAKEYIDFSKLNEDSDPQYTITVNNNGGKPSFAMSTQPKPNPISDINRWLDAFQTYVAVYCARHPQESPAIMKYMATIRDMAQKGSCWIKYDTLFRKQRAVYNWGWDHINWELFFQCQQRTLINKEPKQKGLHNNTNRPFRVPQGFCFTFHKGNKCQRPQCQFKHFCFQCGKKHPASECQSKTEESGKKKHRSSDNAHKY